MNFNLHEIESQREENNSPLSHLKINFRFPNIWGCMEVLIFKSLFEIQFMTSNRNTKGNFKQKLLNCISKQKSSG